MGFCNSWWIINGGFRFTISLDIAKLISQRQDFNLRLILAAISFLLDLIKNSFQNPSQIYQKEIFMIACDCIGIALASGLMIYIGLSIVVYLFSLVWLFLANLNWFGWTFAVAVLIFICIPTEMIEQKSEISSSKRQKMWKIFKLISWHTLN